MKTPTGRPPPRAANWFVSATSVLFLALGVLMLLATLGRAPPLAQRDALFGFRTRTVLWLVGPLHLGLGAYLLLAKDLGSRGFLALWAGVNYTVYYLGMVYGMGVAAPFPVEVLVAWESGLSSKAVDAFWRGFSAYLILGGLTLILLDRRQLKRLAAAAFLGRWKQIRQQQQVIPQIGPPPSAPSAPAEAAQRKPPAFATAASGNLPAGEFKFSCPNCGQHIRCEEGYAGRKIACPACREEIHVPGRHQWTQAPR